MEPEKETSSPARTSLWLLAPLGILVSLLAILRPIRKSHHQTNPTGDPHTNTGNEHGNIPTVSTDTPANPIPADTRKHETHSHKPHVWEKIASVAQLLIALVTLGLLIVNFRQMNANRKAAEGALRSANVAAKQLELVERPKVLGSIKFTRDARIDSREGMDIDLLLTLNNSGQTAAVKTYIQSDMRPILRMGGPEVDEVRDRLCQSAMKMSEAQTSNFYPAVYPGIPARMGIGLKIQPTLINEMIRNGQAIMPFVVICVAYHPDFTDADYNTAFVYHIARLDKSRPGERLIFLPQYGTIPLEQLDAGEPEISSK